MVPLTVTTHEVPLAVALHIRERSEGRFVGEPKELMEESNIVLLRDILCGASLGPPYAYSYNCVLVIIGGARDFILLLLLLPRKDGLLSWEPFTSLPLPFWMEGSTDSLEPGIDRAKVPLCEGPRFWRELVGFKLLYHSLVPPGPANALPLRAPT